MIRSVSVAVVVTACGACASAPGAASRDICEDDAPTAVAAMVDAHGGTRAWQALESIYVEREHLFAGSERAIRFNIYGEYPSHRIYQVWSAPAGVLAWDGERAWSSGWPLAEQLMPRYVAGIGFYLVNMPWLVQRDARSLESLGCSGTLPGKPGQRYLVIAAGYEADPVRKPEWFAGPRDSYELYIDPATHRLHGVMQHWTFAGRLDSAGLPASVNEISQLFVPHDFVEVNGLVLPGSYTAYTPEHEVAARGRFFDYDFSRQFDEGLWVPDDTESVDWDTSSSYNRRRE